LIDWSNFSVVLLKFNLRDDFMEKFAVKKSAPVSFFPSEFFFLQAEELGSQGKVEEAQQKLRQSDQMRKDRDSVIAVLLLHFNSGKITLTKAAPIFSDNGIRSTTGETVGSLPDLWSLPHCG
jgi:hypothetical protein